MKPKTKNQFITLTALLTALAIVIPMVMPAKIIIPPASYTLASHVPIFLAMFISPLMTLIVILGSTFGFLVAGYPIVIVLRALSHLFFGLVGALYLKKYPKALDKPIQTWILNIVLAFIQRLLKSLLASSFTPQLLFQQICFIFFSYS